jgi:prepilin-type N-terminal cleavage/methylation domain-containing protein
VKTLKQKAFTLVELLAAMLILSGSIVTVLLYSADSLAVSMDVERRVKSTLLAEREMEKIKNTLRASFDTDFTAWSGSLGDNFLISRTSSDVNATLKIAAVSVGYDSDKDSTLDSDEILTAITTKIVERN